MTIRVNGEVIVLDQPCNVADLLALRNHAKTPCAVEVNQQIVPKKRHAEHALNDGDRVEIVTLVGGG